MLDLVNAMPDARISFAARYCNSTLIVAGGRIAMGGIYSDLTTAYKHTDTLGWIPIAPLNQGRFFYPGCSVVYRDKVCVVGGETSSATPSRLVECFDMVNDKWVFETNLPVSERCTGAVSIKDFIYVVVSNGQTVIRWSGSVWLTLPKNPGPSSGDASFVLFRDRPCFVYPQFICYDETLSEWVAFHLTPSVGLYSIKNVVNQ